MFNILARPNDMPPHFGQRLIKLYQITKKINGESMTITITNRIIFLKSIFILQIRLTLLEAKQSGVFDRLAYCQVHPIYARLDNQAWINPAWRNCTGVSKPPDSIIVATLLGAITPTSLA